MIARRVRLLACLTLLALASAEPAYAQAVGGKVGAEFGAGIFGAHEGSLS